MVLENQFQSFSLQINKLDEEHIELDSLKFISISNLQDESIMSIDLLEIETNKTVSTWEDANTDDVDAEALEANEGDSSEAPAEQDSEVLSSEDGAEAASTEEKE